MDFFPPEQRGKGLHDIEIQSTTWTINMHLKSARPFHGCILLLAFHCQVILLYGWLSLPFLYTKPILMLHCCTYNVSTNMADVLLHVKLRRGRCAAAATKLGRLNVLTQRMIT